MPGYRIRKCNEKMKRTPFTDLHISLGARMQPFAGYNMPVEYTGINDEHITVREKAGVFDVSHMGEFRLEGPGAAGFLQSITTNDVSRLSDGEIQYSCMPNGRGGIIDDLLIYRFKEDSFMMVVNASNIEKDWQWCLSHAGEWGLTEGAGIYNVSDDIALLAVQGPHALDIVRKLTDEPVAGMKYYTFRETVIAGIKNSILSITGYTGSGGCEIYVPVSQGPVLWDALFDAGRDHGLKPAGLGARDTLRLEAGFCLYGNDIDETTSPIEAGLGWITKFTDGNDFIDRDLFWKQKTGGPSRKLVGFVMNERAIPRFSYQIADMDGNIIGRVTSGTMSPMLKTGIGMGYVKPEFSSEGSGIKILIRNKAAAATVVRPPFFKKDSKV
jgi:aminomethyltransferase